jgi:hypothetical protein
MAQVPNILQFGGLHPRTVLRERGIPFSDDPDRWSNDAGKAEDLAPYLAAGIARPWGMMKDDPTCVVFGLRRRLLWRPGTAFLGDWSSRGEIKGLADVHARRSVEHFDAMFDNANSNFPAPLPGEVLLEGSVGLEDVLVLYARSEEHSSQLINLVDTADFVYDGPDFPIEVAGWVFGQR